MPGHRTPLNASQALERLSAHPALAELIVTLPAPTLTRLYHAVGLHDAGSLMAATPPALLARALDEAVWQDGGGDTRFDADVFVDWLEVWLDVGHAWAAERLTALDEETLTLAFAELLRVEDTHVTGFCRDPEDAGDLLQPDDHAALFDRFLVAARQDDEWHAVQGALLALWDHDPDRLLALLQHLSLAAAHVSRSGAHRLHGDAAAARDSRREGEGFVSAESARAFLGMALALTPEALAALDDYDPESARHLARLQRAAAGHHSAASGPDAARDHGVPGTVNDSAVTPDIDPPAESVPAAAQAELHALLFLAGVSDAAAPAPLLSGPAEGSLTVEQRLRALADDDPAAFQGSAAELAYLANVLRASPAVLAGATSRAQERARTLAIAVTNLGLELLEARAVTVRPGRPPGLVQPFLVGWRTLLELPGRVVRALDQGLAAPTTVERLAARPWLASDVNHSQDALHRAVAAGDFTAAREALGLLSLVFDAEACRAAAHLLALPPAFPVRLEGGHHTAQRPLRSREDLRLVSGLLQVLALGGALSGPE